MKGTSSETTIMMNDPAGISPVAGYTGWYLGQTPSFGASNNSFGIARFSAGGAVAGTGLWINASGNVGIRNPAPATGFVLDVNGPSQSAVLYSNVTANATITPAYFGTFYNITAGTTYTIALNASPGTSNIGKYNVFRNNTGASLSFTVTGGSGVTSPVACADKQSITLMVATATTYALF